MTREAPTGEGIRVVVSDDHPVVREGLRSYLESQGFDVVGEAADGNEAIRVVRDLRPDVLLTDLVMPGVDGIETIRRLRAEGQPLGILVLTSFSGSDQVIPAIQAGADGYFDDAGYPAGEGWDRIELPDAADGAFCVEITGDSMDPLYREGDRVIVERDGGSLALLIPVSLGSAAYGLAYFFVHDVYIHRRFGLYSGVVAPLGVLAVFLVQSGLVRNLFAP